MSFKNQVEIYPFYPNKFTWLEIDHRSNDKCICMWSTSLSPQEAHDVSVARQYL